MIFHIIKFILLLHPHFAIAYTMLSEKSHLSLGNPHLIILNSTTQMLYRGLIL